MVILAIIKYQITRRNHDDNKNIQVRLPDLPCIDLEVIFPIIVNQRGVSRISWEITPTRLNPQIEFGTRSENRESNSPHINQSRSQVDIFNLMSL